MLTVIKDAALAARETVEGGEVDLTQRGRGGPPGGPRVGAAHPRASPGVARGRGRGRGGLGVAVVLDGVYACVTGEEIEVPEEAEDDVPDLEAIHAQEEAWGYCTEFLVDGFSGDADEFGEWIYASGRSVFVVADDDVVKVHLHTQDPGEALTYAGRLRPPRRRQGGRHGGAGPLPRQGRVEDQPPTWGSLRPAAGRGTATSSSRWARS